MVYNSYKQTEQFIKVGFLLKVVQCTKKKLWTKTFFKLKVGFLVWSIYGKQISFYLDLTYSILQ